MNKYELMWEKNAVHNPAVKQAQYASFFDVETENYDLPILEEGKHEQAFDEMELLGFPLCSPFDLIAAEVGPTISSDQLKSYMGQSVSILGYYVARKHVTTVNKRHMNFGTWLDNKGKFFDTVHFPPSLVRSPFTGKGCYLIRGKVVEDFGFPSIEVWNMERLPYVKDERY
jgi:DNA polymerase-3 subunit alpha